MKTAHAVPRQPVVLIILDGFGVNPGRLNNAVQQAKTPRLDDYFSHHGHNSLEASGRAVGLPEGQMGNSEVGHLTLGCGCITRQDLVRIDDSVQDGSFYKISAFLSAMEKAKAADRPIHLVGLVSDGGVHSHITHLLALIRLCAQQGVRPMVHMMTDGRDTAPRHARTYLPSLYDALEGANGTIATISGRYHAMDRDNRWDRTKLAWDVMVNHKGCYSTSAEEAIENAYEHGRGDEFIKPTVLPGAVKIADDDSVIFFNFRNDRPRQLAEALSLEEFGGFDRGDYEPVTVTCMTEYDPKYLAPIAFAPERPPVMLGKVVSLAGLRQFHCAETEKYAHVTYFFNGGKEQPFAGEDRLVVPSPKVATYDMKPEMSAKEVADAVITAIESEQYGFIVVNFANGDMVGHTAVREAIVIAVETLDKEAGRVLDCVKKNNWSAILTADHGNCDEMIDPVTGEPHTQHTTYPVPCLVVDKAAWRLANGQGLSSVAPTVLQLMGIPQPAEMSGNSMLLEEVDVS
ncbi:MAG: 2,3-bisphosphoglycerate-independent phosphoglycerate mutase [Gammaproteobacteria bacterium]|nr:2,3-bisphosphoglycerate-independent phosphoglycerate mutase [Gammaproteobacteria bacterium]